MDECELIDCEEVGDRVIVTFTTPDGGEQKVEAVFKPKKDREGSILDIVHFKPV